MMWDGLWRFLIIMRFQQLAFEQYLTLIGWRKRPAIYGAIIFAQDEWTKP